MAVAVTGVLLAGVLAVPAAAQENPAAAKGPLTVELNKFEPGETGDSCKTFFLFRNQTGLAFEGFEMSLAVLDGQGVIDQLLTIDAAPLPVARTTLKLFEIPAIGCADISELLLHEIGACRPQNEGERDCFEMIELVSRTDAGLVK